MARTATTVDRGLFETAVKNAEANGALKTLADLYVAIVKHYMVLTLERSDLKPISAAIAKDRLTEWQIQVQTEPGRKQKPDLFAARMTELKEALAAIRGTVPVEMAELLGLFDELEYTINKPLEPVVVADKPVESAEDEEVVDPNEEIAAAA